MLLAHPPSICCFLSYMVFINLLSARPILLGVKYSLNLDLFICQTKFSFAGLQRFEFSLEWTPLIAQRLWTRWFFFCVQIIREPEKFLLDSQVTLSRRVFIAKEAFEERKLSVACLNLITIAPSQTCSWSTRLFLYTSGNTIIWTDRILTKINLNAVSSIRHSWFNCLRKNLSQNVIPLSC